MKKHLLSIITTALVVVNLIMSIVIVFTVLPTTSKINNLVTQICAALALDLDSSGDGAESLKIEDMETYAVGDGEEMTINLKSGEDGKDHYALIKCSIVVNKKHEDYDKYVGSITEKSSLIKDAINSEVSNFTIEEMKSNPEDVQQAILERLQKLFNSRFIVKVTFDNIVYQ